MTISEALKELVKSSGLSQRAFIAKAGYAGASSIANPIKNNDLNVSTLIRFADTAGYEVALIPCDCLSDNKVLCIEQSKPVKTINRKMKTKSD